ncbi:MAG: CpaD family pilus assembly lipoprotein [Candidatus Pseudomonas phytovorans]|uniref:CpaD family pilus assembly lipoprotein n=1 Tax=Candidatus Pseudomonas phytovorans TaxID=3121377 RepID=A0AAJ5WG40_9PSED|nr:CpaD family pilus assembly lipoprotein [Pseudomonas sp.]WEK29038.1 MAG: CpaD family pilus assembly lipoprotein [Pseudomonas sp.]
MHLAKPVFVALSLGLLLTGCDRFVNDQRTANYAPEAPLPAIRAVPSALVAHLKTTAAGGLDQASLADLNTLLARQGRLSQQTLTLRPSTPNGEQVANRLATLLRQLGARQVIQAPTQLQRGGDTDLQVVSEAVVAQVPDCTIANPDQVAVKPFIATGNLGCANRANIARMVADPRDLNRGQALDGGDGIAASNAVDRYQRQQTAELLDINFNKD